MRIKNGKDLRLALLNYFEELYSKELRIYRITIFIICCILCLSIVLAVENITEEISITSIIINSFAGIFFAIMSIGMILFLISIENEKVGSFFRNRIFKSLYKSISNTETIVRDGICDISINYEKKYCIVEFFTHSKNFINDIQVPKLLIEEALGKILPYSKLYKNYIIINGLQPSYVDNSELLDNKIEKIIEAEITEKVKYINEEVTNKGIEMSKVYYYLYCLENSIREFIELRSKMKFGDNYAEKIFISRSIQKKIEQRRDNEKKYKYISFRGGNFLFYLDFKELGDIIINNKYLLDSFPDEIWVKAKINEMGNIRNLIAHNSYVGNHELEIIKITFQSILMQFDK